MKPDLDTADDGLSDRARILRELAGGVVRRHADLTRAGARDAAIARMAEQGEIERLGRGLYQMPDADADRHQTLLEAARRVPRAVICLTSALVFHDLTDALPAKVWMAIGRKDRKPRIDYPPMRFVRFPPERFSAGVDIHQVMGGEIKVTDPAHTIVDLFRYRDKVGLALAIEGLREGLARGCVTPAAVAETACAAKAWRVVRPYLEAMAHG